MVERLILPHGPLPPKQSVNRVGRGPFDGRENLGQRVGIAVLVPQWCEDHMHVVRHHHNPVDMYLSAVVVKAMMKDDMPNRFRQRPETFGAESHEKGLVVRLHVREMATIQASRSTFPSLDGPPLFLSRRHSNNPVIPRGVGRGRPTYISAGTAALRFASIRPRKEIRDEFLACRRHPTGRMEFLRQRRAADLYFYISTTSRTSSTRRWPRRSRPHIFRLRSRMSSRRRTTRLSCLSVSFRISFRAMPMWGMYCSMYRHFRSASA